MHKIAEIGPAADKASLCKLCLESRIHLGNNGVVYLRTSTAVGLLAASRARGR